MKEGEDGVSRNHAHKELKRISLEENGKCFPLKMSFVLALFPLEESRPKFTILMWPENTMFAQVGYFKSNLIIARASKMLLWPGDTMFA